MQKSRSQTKSQCLKKTSSNVRIIGGQMRGRKIQFADSKGLRPTLDRIRETLFNWLAWDIADSHCLDLFAGSGALGFEAASRGAKEVTLVELNPQVAGQLQQNCRTLQAHNIKVCNQSAAAFLKDNSQAFDIIFLDPPFGEGLLDITLTQLSHSVKNGTLLYIEQEKVSSPTEPKSPWRQIKFKQTSNFSFALYQFDTEQTG